MSLSAGTRIGTYEITAPLGTGGMGEVYRALDTNLGRQVAIKVLPETFAQDAERLARFEREARTLAALNHPHIAQIYGIERGPAEAGHYVQALVMELVEGPTLADRIAQGPIPVDEVLPIARQIAEALEAAHEQGIIHRDLKPANVKLRPDGVAKVLDFGLAKALEPSSAAGIDATASPTITSPAMMTGIGVLLGTAAYMSPEQARGKPVDKRSDIWAFGCVVYEMLTGRRAFDGEDIADVLGAVVRLEPDWDALPASAADVRSLLRACLEKDRRKRIGDIAAAMFAIDEAGVRRFSRQADLVGPTELGDDVRQRWQRRVLGISAAALAAGSIGTGTAVWFATRPEMPRVVRTTIAAPGEGVILPGVSITPDGLRVVFASNDQAGGPVSGRLFVRALERLEPVSIATGRLAETFVSPDGRWIGFWDDSRTLKKVPITGGPALTVTQVTSTGPRGSVWLPDDTIVFAAGASGVGLQRVPAAGGTATVLTRPDRTRGEIEHVFPSALPGAGAVLFTIVDESSGLDAAQVAVYDLQANRSKVLFRGGSEARYVASGHLVYRAQGALRAVPFDLRRLEISGSSVLIEPLVTPAAPFTAAFDVAANGTLVYAHRVDPGNQGRSLIWVERNGRETPIPAPPRTYRHARLSPDGTRIVLYDDGGQDNNLWMWDLRRPALTRLTSGPDTDQSPVWTPDSQRIVFASTREGGVYNLWWQAVDGTGRIERLTMSPVNQFPTDMTPDGAGVVFHQTTASGRDLMRLALDQTRMVSPLLQTRFDERNGVISPDGRWLAYDSDSSGQFEVYVRPFPNTAGGQSQVSTMGGTRPMWARRGKELFFSAPDGAMMRAAAEPIGASWHASAPTRLLGPGYLQLGGGNVLRPFDVSIDDQRFLMIKAPSGDSTGLPTTLVIAQHFDEELKRLVPAN